MRCVYVYSMYKKSDIHHPGNKKKRKEKEKKLSAS